MPPARAGGISALSSVDCGEEVPGGLRVFCFDHHPMGREVVETDVGFESGAPDLGLYAVGLQHGADCVSVKLTGAAPHWCRCDTKPVRARCGSFRRRLSRELIDECYSAVRAHIESWTVLSSTLRAVPVAHSLIIAHVARMRSSLPQR